MRKQQGGDVPLEAPSPYKREEIVQIMVVEEAALVDGDTLAEVIIPMMNVPRPHGAGGVNPTEPHSQQIYIKFLCHYMETYKRKPPELLENLVKARQSAAKPK